MMTRNSERSTGLPRAGTGVVTRRQFLRAAASASAAAGIAGCTARRPSGSQSNFERGVETTSQEQRIQGEPSVRLSLVAEGLGAPVGFEVATESSDRRFVTDQTGQIFVHGPDGIEAEPFLDITDRLVDVNTKPFEERGLLGLAFHPGFASNRRFYVRYSSPPRDGTPDGYDHTEILSEFQASEDRESADPESERVLLAVPSPQPNHNSGDVVFGPDGYLYVGMGDGGGGKDSGPGHVEDWYEGNDGGNGQDVTSNLLGSVLRIDVDDIGEDRPYGVPEDNPLVGTDGLDEHYAWGLRNPWGMSFDDGRLFVADPGENDYEEVNVVAKGGNYGWNVKEGTHCFRSGDCPDETLPEVRGGEPLVDPIIEYPHEADVGPAGNAVIGGYVYRNSTVAPLEGRYVFGDWSTSFDEPKGAIFAASPSDEEGALWSVDEVSIAGSPDGAFDRYVLGFGRARTGELYVLSTIEGAGGETGAVHRIAPAG